MPTALAEAAPQTPDARAGSSRGPASSRMKTAACTRASCLPTRAPSAQDARATLPTSAATRALQRLFTARVIAALATPGARAHDWQQRAQCATEAARASTEPRAFFAEAAARAAQDALAVYVRCAVRANRLIEALSASGIGSWGGTTHAARTAYARRIQPRVDARPAARSRTTP